MSTELVQRSQNSLETPLFELTDLALSIPHVYWHFKLRWCGLFASIHEYNPTEDFWWCRAIKALDEEVERRHPNLNPVLGARGYLNLWVTYLVDYIIKKYPDFELEYGSPKDIIEAKFRELTQVLKEILALERQGEKFDILFLP
ncbi:MAG: hypothetical protein LBI53_06720 [Candidatus Peribacteria bacterium]|nr:hypothetical protein [Candidatus Peribacteria bacterium]